jgi:hypothetical protein
MGTPPPPEAEAMMSIQPLHLTAAALTVILDCTLNLPPRQVSLAQGDCFRAAML